MIAKIQLSKRFQQLHDDIWPFTQYEANSRTRHWEYPFAISQINDYLNKKKISSFKNLSIIEMGAANSCLQFYYAKKGVDYTSVNVSEKAFDGSIEKRLKVKINHIIGRFEDVNINRTYDLVLCISVMEHTQKNNERKILKNISQALKPGGRAIFTLDWFFNYKIGESCRWGHNPDCKSLIDISKEQGLNLIVGDKNYLSGFAEFNEKEIKKEAFVLKVCNKGIWLTSQAFVLEKVK
ncbi:MAG: methyltransferase [Patescibacteria group bacterium]